MSDDINVKPGMLQKVKTAIIEETSHEIWASTTGTIYRMGVDGDKMYPYVTINSSGKSQQVEIDAETKKKYLGSRLVAEAFLSNPHGATRVRYKDKNTLNHELSNLEWSVPKTGVIATPTLTSNDQMIIDFNKPKDVVAEQLQAALDRYKES